MMPDAAELAQIGNDLQNSLFADTCDILSVTSVNTGQGGVTDTWGTVSGGSALPCRIEAFASKGASSFRGNEYVIGGAVQGFSQWVVTLATDINVTVEHRVRVNGYDYNVIVADKGKSWDVDRRLIVEKID